MAFEIRIAERKQAKIRIGLSSVSGGGKTMSALLLAKGLAGGDWSKVAMIDTEQGSGDLYAHMGAFNVVPLVAPFSPERYIECIKLCESAGMKVIIVDSMSHEWEGEGGIIWQKDRMQGADAWSKLTPKHDAFKQAILQSTCHMITTLRRKTEYTIEETVNAKGYKVSKPVKQGLKTITRDGWDYELTIDFEIDQQHYCIAPKDRTELFANIDPFIITEQTGANILNWCQNGAVPAPPAKKPCSDANFAKMVKRIQEQGELGVYEKAVETFNLTPGQHDNLKEYNEQLNRLETAIKLPCSTHMDLSTLITELRNEGQAMRLHAANAEMLAATPLLMQELNEKIKQLKA